MAPRSKNVPLVLSTHIFPRLHGREPNSAELRKMLKDRNHRNRLGRHLSELSRDELRIVSSHLGLKGLQGGVSKEGEIRKRSGKDEMLIHISNFLNNKNDTPRRMNLNCKGARIYSGFDAIPTVTSRSGLTSSSRSRTSSSSRRSSSSHRPTRMFVNRRTSTQSPQKSTSSSPSEGYPRDIGDLFSGIQFTDADFANFQGQLPRMASSRRRSSPKSRSSSSKSKSRSASKTRSSSSKSKSRSASKTRSSSSKSKSRSSARQSSLSPVRFSEGELPSWNMSPPRYSPTLLDGNF